MSEHDPFERVTVNGIEPKSLSFAARPVWRPDMSTLNSLNPFPIVGSEIAGELTVDLDTAARLIAEYGDELVTIEAVSVFWTAHNGWRGWIDRLRRRTPVRHEHKLVIADAKLVVPEIVR